LLHVRAIIVVVLFAALAVSLIVVSSCSKTEKAIGEIRELFEAGEYDETIAHCRHALRRDIRDAGVYYYYGLALLELGRDYEAWQQLDTCVQINSALSGQIAAYVFASAETDFLAGRNHRAGRRFKAAIAYDPSMELGAYQFITGDVFYDEKQYETAIEMYHAAVTEFADSSLVERTLYRLAIAYQAADLEDSSRASLKKLLEDYPRGEYATEAGWRLANLLFDMGERELANGNFEAVIEITDELLELTENSTLAQKGRFIRGEAYEGLGEFKKAYNEYRAVIRQDRGASGRIVQRAEAKIAVLREAGLF
jgi:tetratricopeptide (TPR) repeat protein